MMFDTSDPSSFMPWYLRGNCDALGHVTPVIADHLSRARLFRLIDQRLSLDPGTRLDEAFAAIRASLFAAGLIGPERHELMPVRLEPYGAQLATIDRSALRALGLWATKIHVNGLVEAEGTLRPRVWLSRRSASSNAAPLAYDTMIAGGQPAGASLVETLAKESEEEVGLPRRLSATARKVKDIVVRYESELGLHREVLAIYDLSVPATFQPDHRDGEIVESALLDWPRFQAAVDGSLPMKFSSRVVSKDLLARLGQAAERDRLTSMPKAL